MDPPISAEQSVDPISQGAEPVANKPNEEAAEEAQEVEPPSGSQPSAADLLTTPRGKAPPGERWISSAEPDFTTMGQHPKWFP